ncbi:hypothetical protein [Cupriavidus sp. 8B]
MPRWTPAQATEQKQWARLGTRLAENAARMRANGVTIQDNPAPAVQLALRDAGAGAVTAWRTRVGIERAGVLDAFTRNERAAR